MAKEYLTIDGKLMSVDGKLVQVPDPENINDLADSNLSYATLMSDTVDNVEDLLINGVIDGSPKGVYDDLSTLQTALPDGASGVYVTKDNGHWYFWNDTEWVDGGAYRSDEDVKQIKEDLVNVTDNVDGLKMMMSTAEKMKGIKQPINKPNGFDWNGYDITLYRDFIGNISTDLENHNFKQGGKTYYVSPNGNDSNDGLTKQNPLQSVRTAYLKSDVNTIICLEGIYNYNMIMNEMKITKSVDIIADGEVIFSPFMNRYWAKTDGYNHVYEISRSMVSIVLDTENVDSDGFFIPLTKVDSISACDNLENSWYTDGSKVYAHRKNNASVVWDELMAILEKPNLILEGDFNAYIEGITFYGGGDSKGCVNCSKSVANYNNAHVFKNCKFLYATSGSGNIMDIGASLITINCVSAHSKLDGFSHTSMENIESKSIEINCTVYDCGSNITGSDQASTTHSNSKLIRVNGDYSRSYGPNIQDENEGTQSWNLGCVFHDDINSVEGYPKSSVCASSGGKIWLDTCGCYNNEFTMWSLSNSEIHYKKCIFDRLSTKGSGLIEEY